MFDDAAVDTLIGGSHPSWFFAEQFGPFADIIRGLRKGEIVDGIDPAM